MNGMVCDCFWEQHTQRPAACSEPRRPRPRPAPAGAALGPEAQLNRSALPPVRARANAVPMQLSLPGSSWLCTRLCIEGLANSDALGLYSCSRRQSERGMLSWMFTRLLDCASKVGSVPNHLPKKASETSPWLRGAESASEQTCSQSYASDWAERQGSESGGGNDHAQSESKVIQW